MRMFDMFSGIGGFSKAAENLGIEVIGHAQIDKYANQVYDAHFDNPNLGDVTESNILRSAKEFEILAGGSPCQDLSIAKKNRAGLSGERSSLFFAFVDFFIF